MTCRSNNNEIYKLNVTWPIISNIYSGTTMQKAMITMDRCSIMMHNNKAVDELVNFQDICMMAREV